MYIRKFYHEGLGHAAYLVACMKKRKAIVIDPARIVVPYLDLCREMGFSLEAVAETHIHADYVSGAKELWAQEECTWYFPRVERPEVTQENQIIVQQNASFLIGDIRFSVIHTPGHTPEHVCYLVEDSVNPEIPVGMFSGDFLFVGDVGRPDLLEKVVGMAGNAKVSARQMYLSIQKLRDLPDYLQIWPSHGAGSLCGKALGNLPSSTLGYERRTNWAFQVNEEEEFVERLLDAQPEAPPYFKKMKYVNECGPGLLIELDQHSKLIPIANLKSCLTNQLRVVDTRSHSEYAEQYLPGSINIPFGKSFIQWAGWLLSDDKPFYILAKKEQIRAIKNDLLCIGLDEFAGFFDVDAIFLEDREYHSYNSVNVQEVNSEMTLVDVRQAHEWNQGHIPGAIHIPLGKLAQSLESIPRTKSVGIYCQAGLRSAIAMSILRSSGYENVINIEGGYNSFKQLEQCVI